MNTKKALIGIFIGVIIFTSLIVINHFLTLSRIYYKISYDGDVNDLQTIVEKSELFDYQKYCTLRDFEGTIYNLTSYAYFYHIDKNFIDSLKTKITNDQMKFQMNPFYAHHFTYSLDASNESLLYFTYNNNSIIKLDDGTHTDIFSARENHYGNSSTFWEGSWYLNFTLIPFSPNLNSTIQLNDSILVKMNLVYDYIYGNVGAESLLVDQFLCFNSNYQIVFVYIPINSLIVA